MSEKVTLARVKATPLEQEALAYEIVLPASWGVDGIEIGSKDILVDRMLPLGLFTGAPAGLDVIVSVAATRLSRQVVASEWMQAYAISHGHEILEMNEVSREQALAHSSFDLSGKEQGAILNVVIDGDRLFFVQGFSAASNLEFIQDQLKDYVESFSLLATMGDYEPAQVHTGVCGKVLYALDGVWAVRQMGVPSDKGAGVDCFASTPEGPMNCWVRIKYRSTKKAPTLENDITFLGQDLQGANIKFLGELRQEKIPADAGFLDGGLMRVFWGHPVDKPESELEVCCVALAAGMGALSFFFLHPTAKNDPLAWAQGHRSIAAFLASLQVIP